MSHEKICDTDNRQEVLEKSRATLAPHIVAYIEECMAREQPRSQLINVLHRVQGEYGYLDRIHLEAVSQLMQIPASKVSGVATFYHYFRLVPRGKFVIHVCLGTACFVKGAERMTDRLREELGIDFGETTRDGLFSLEPARCLGTCAMAPVLMINDRIHGNVTPDKIPAIIEEYVQMAEKEATAENN